MNIKRSILTGIFCFVIMLLPIGVAKADNKPTIGKPQARAIIWSMVEDQWRVWGSYGTYDVHSCTKENNVVHCIAESDGLTGDGMWSYHCVWSARVKGHFRKNSILLIYKHSEPVCDNFIER